MKNNNKGFSLVELIVVIAIMAILAAVAVVGFSVYIPKAQQASDKQMVGDIEYALELHAQSTPNDVTAGYVILTPNGAQATEGFATDVLKATYGDDWANELKLAYDKWETSSVLQTILENVDGVQNIAGSSYLNHSSAGEMISAVTVVTDALSDMAAGASKDPLETLGLVGALSQEQLDAVAAELDTLDLSWDNSANADNSAYSTALSNILVKTVAGEVGNTNLDDDSQSSSVLATNAQLYASLYAWSLVDPAGKTEFEKLNSAITNEQSSAQDILDAFTETKNTITAENSAYLKYMEETGTEDAKAAIIIMGAVNDVAQNYDMTSSDLYTSNAVANDLNTYVGTINAITSLDPDQIAVLDQMKDGDIVMFVSADGIITVVPNIE